MDDQASTPTSEERTGTAGAEAAADGGGAPEATPDESGDGGDAGVVEAGPEQVREAIREALRGVKDPELGVNIVDLGLVYDIELGEGGVAKITMTLTSPGCPAGGQILSGAKNAAEEIVGVDAAQVNLVWKPFWTPDRIDPKVRAALGF